MTKKIKTLSNETLPMITLDMIQNEMIDTGMTTSPEPETPSTDLQTLPETELEIHEPTTPIEPETTPEPETIEPTLIEMTGLDGKKFFIIDPETLPLDTDKTPISKRMGEKMILKMEDGFRTSGDHPNIKKTPKWMINPIFNGKERWMDLTKETGFNLEKGLIILSRSQIQHKGGMEKFTLGRMIISE